MNTITETIDGHTFVLTPEGALCIILPSGHITTLNQDAAAALRLFLERPDVDQRLEDWLIAQEVAA